MPDPSTVARPALERLTNETGLLRQLTAGQMAMVGVGGSIGTGLLLGSGAAIHIAGPAVILSFLAAALISWTVTLAMGEMASVHPAAGSFGYYAELYLNSWAGFVSRYAYWFAMAIAIGGEMIAAATYMHLWLPQVKPLLWVMVFSALLLGVNLRRVADYARFEYWFAMVKLVTIIAFFVIGATLLLSRQVLPQYTAVGGFSPNGPSAPMRAMTFALFTFGGIEMVAVSSGESRSGGEVARAVKITFALLTFAYLGAIVVLVGVMPWNRAGVSESPFVTVFRHVGLPAASHVMNFVVLTAALSGANASLYVDSRMLFSLARGDYAPRAVGNLTAHGVPLRALLVSGCGILAALVMEKWAPANAFVSILGVAIFGAMASWLVALAAHVRFRQRLTKDQLATLPFRSPVGGSASVVGFVAIVVAISATWGFSSVAVTSGVLYLVVLSLAFLLVRKRTPHNS